jgi:hypothetical protein
MFPGNTHVLAIWRKLHGDRIGRIYELGEEQTSEVYTVSCSTKTVGLEQFWA